MSDRLLDNPCSDFTIVKNAVFDHILPTLSSDGWKVLCVALRQTWGWTGDPSQALVSLAQFTQKTGIENQGAIEKAIQECLGAGYLVSRAADSGETRYALNTGFEVGAPRIEPAPEVAVAPLLSPEQENALQALLDFAQEMGADPDLTQAKLAVSKNDPDTVRVWIETGRDMSHLEAAVRFKTVVARLLDQVPPLPIQALGIEFPPAAVQDRRDLPDQAEALILAEESEPKSDALPAPELWQATLDTLRPRTKRSQFKWLKPTQGVELVRGVLTVLAPNKRTKEWLETGQLAPAIQEALESVAGEAIELVFVEEL